jgi:UDP-N-acetylglucosamine 1-carboxyvinyltransferase
MAKFIVKGGNPLRGAVSLGGAKNASFKLMIAAMLAESESRLLNLSQIGDVDITKKTLLELGIGVRECGERTMFISPNKQIKSEIPLISGEKSRASTLFASALLSLTGKAIIPQPGGCVLGVRPIDRHLDGLKALGANIEEVNGHIKLECQKLIGTTFRFGKKTHTGTECLILAAVKAQGKTIIENAAQEPEIDDLINYLNKMGGKIKRENENKIIIDGVRELGGAIHKVMPDRNEAVSYAVAAIATKGDIVVENAREKDLKTFLQILSKAGGKYELLEYGIRFWYEKPLKATSIKTEPEPGFMTDWQPLWSILMTQASGTSEIIEAVHFNRFQYIDQLKNMGADIKLFNPQIDNSEDYYEFDSHVQGNGEYHGVKITGPTHLQAVKLDVPDLRAGATFVIAALIAPGITALDNIYHIDRGYELLDERLRQLGADIKRA